MRPKRDFRTGSKLNYDAFCSKNPGTKLTYTEYKKILYTYNNYLAVHLLETGEIVKLPFGLGELVINKYKPKRTKINKEGVEKVNLPVDWKTSKEVGKRVYHLNHHTEGYKYYWRWNFHKSRIRCFFAWKLEMARVHSRMLKTYINTPNGKYKDMYKQIKRTG